MFQVLVYVYENYFRGDACPEPQQLGRKLSAVGFDHDEIRQAIAWLEGLNFMAHGLPLGQAVPGDAAASIELFRSELDTPASLRVYSVAEQDHLGAECLGFIRFLEASGVLPAAMREIVLDRAMATPGDPVSLDELKIIVLMVYWSFGEEPDALILDELCEDTNDRLAH